MPDRTWRQRYLPTLDRLLEPLGLYAAYTVGDEELVGDITVPLGAHDVRKYLRSNGYEASTLAALKYHPETGAPDDGSYRRVDDAHPRRQWHVHLFEREGGAVEVFSHYEFRPDLRRVADETHQERVERLREHYRPSWGDEWGDGTTYVVGAACEAVQSLVS